MKWFPNNFLIIQRKIFTKMELSILKMKKGNMNEPSQASDITNQMDETVISKTRFIEDLILNSFIDYYTK